MSGVAAVPRAPRGARRAAAADRSGSGSIATDPAGSGRIGRSRARYGRAHQQARAALIAAARLSSEPTICPLCDELIDLAPGVESRIHADHWPPLAEVGDDLSRTSLRLTHSGCNLDPENKPAPVSGRVFVTGQVVSTAPPVLEGIPWSDGCWRVPWMRGLLRVPADGSAPRFMSAPHPNAVGSYGPRFERWYARRHPGQPLRWWQRLVARRVLEHDRAGRLCWRTIVGPLSPRQQGKSTVVTELLAWRTDQAGLFGPRPQHTVFTSYNVTQAGLVHAHSRVPALADPERYSVGLSRGAETITTRATGATYAVKANNAAYGSSLVAVGVDETWAIPPAPITEGVQPTLLRAESSQLYLLSTAHRACTPLLLDKRIAAIGRLRDPGDTLILEWSADPGADIDDVDALRAAWPWHTPDTLAAALAALGDAQAVEFVEPGAPDPVQSWREQYRNEFPALARVRRLGSEFATEDELAAAVAGAAGAVAGSDSSVLRVVAVDDDAGRGASVVWATPTADGGWWIDAAQFTSWPAAVAAVAASAGDLGGPFRVLAAEPIAKAGLFSGAGLVADPCGTTSTRVGIPATVQAIQAGDVVFAPDSAGLLVSVCAGARVRGKGAGFTRDTDTALVQPLVWAVGAAYAAAAGKGAA